MDMIFLIIGVLVGVTAGYFFAKSKFQGSKNIPEAEFELLKTNLNSLTAEKGRADERSTMLSASLEETKGNLDAERSKVNEINLELSKAMTLTRALKGDTKQRGNWGEFILETILEKSGLERGREFLIQETLSNEEGARLRPDVIIKLPEDKSMVIDSKVSLNAYEAYNSA